MKKILCLFILFFLFTISNVSALGMCPEIKGYIYKTSDNRSLILYKEQKYFFHHISTVPIKTVNTKFTDIITNCDHEIVGEPMRFSNFTYLDKGTVFFNIILHILILILFPVYIAKKISKTKNQKFISTIELLAILISFILFLFIQYYAFIYLFLIFGLEIFSKLFKIKGVEKILAIILITFSIPGVLLLKNIISSIVD